GDFFQPLRGYLVPRGGRRANTGGARPGAGRKPGSATKKTRAIADKAADEGLVPLEVLLDIMRRYYKAEQWKEAAAVAAVAAPFCHPKLTSVTAKGEVDSVVRVVRECIIEPCQRQPEADRDKAASDDDEWVWEEVEDVAEDIAKEA